MGSVESKIMTLIHKVDILYQMIEQLNRKIALIGTKNGWTNNHSVEGSPFDAKISDYYANGEIIDSRRESQNFYSDRASWQPRLQGQNSAANSATNGRSLESSLKDVDLSSPMDRSLLYLDNEVCYPTSEMFDRSLIHQDILGNDNDLEDMVEGEQTEITPDIQIQRLTAQLTAAYNRIAALEEQLVAKRIHA